MTRAEFAEAVYSYCARTGGSVTSWIRSEQRNAVVGGVPFSAHLAGLAVDVVYGAAPTREVRETWARRFGLLVIIEDDHDHLQPIGWRAG